MSDERALALESLLSAANAKIEQLEAHEALRLERERMVEAIMALTPEEFIRQTTRVSGKWDEPDLRATIGAMDAA